MSLSNLEKRISTFKKKHGPILEKIGEFEDEIADDHKWLKKILLISTTISVVIIGLGLFFIFSLSSSSRDVALEISSPGGILRGAPFNIDLSVANNSGALIKNAVLTVNLPQGIIAPDAARDKNIISENIGDITSGNLIKKTFFFVPISDVGSKETLKATLSYSIAAGARFEVRETKEIEISGSAVQMEVKKPEQILSGSTFPVRINYKNESDFNFQSLSLEADYPDGFKYDSSDVPPASLNNFWRLGALSGGASGKLSISGHLNLSAGANISLPVKILADFGGQAYEIANGAVSLSPASSPISLQILVNGRSEYTTQVGETLNYTIQYQNLSGIALADAKIKATLSGEMADLSSLTTDGSFNPITKVLSWDSSNNPDFKMLNPGAGGEVKFKIKVKGAFNLKKLNDRNFSIHLNAVMSSPSVPYYISASQTSVESISDVKIAGLIIVSVQGFFNDDPTGTINSGSLPPKVGQPTQYMIHWLVRNFAADANNIEVKSVLAPGVKIVGQPSANLGKISYDEGEGRLTWEMDRVAAAKGVLNDPAEAIFQIEATPNESMLDGPEPLLGATVLTGTDNFTGLPLESEFPAFTTASLNDTAGSDESFVIK